MPDPLKNWAIAAVVGGVAWIALTFVKAVVLKRVLRFQAELAGARSIQFPHVQAILESLRSKTRQWFILGLSALAGLQALDSGILSAPKLALAGKLVIALSLLQAWLWISDFLNRWLEHKTKAPSTDATALTSLRAILFLMRLALAAALLLLALDNFGVNITALVAGLGIGGVAIALAVQNILGDLFASLTIVLDKPFVLGDTIQVGDIIGTIENIGLKTTRLRSISGEELILPNADLLQSRVRNYKRMEERRTAFRVGVTYSTPAQKLRAIPEWIREIVSRHPEARLDRVHFAEMAASSLDFEIVYFIDSPEFKDHMDLREKVNLAIFEKFSAEGVEFAYPTQTVYVAQPTPPAAPKS